MSVAAVFSIQRQQSLHLYRALLRQCTYLPDEIARREIKKQVVNRFHAHKVSDHESTKEVPLSKERQERIKKRLISGWQNLRTLKRANEGSPLSLRLVFRHAYGRTGKRRHELVQALLGSSRPHESSAARGNATSNGDGGGNPWDVTTVRVSDIFVPVKNESKQVIEYHIASKYDQLRAIIASQTKIHTQLSTRAKIKEHIPSTPMLNSWLRSMPRKRVRNMAVKHYAYLIDHVLPPIPIEEWRRLQRLVSGDRPCEIVPKRLAPQGKQDLGQLTQRDLEALAKLSAEEAVTKTSTEIAVESEFSPTLSQDQSQKPISKSDPTSANAARQKVLEAEIKLLPRSALKRNRHNDPHFLTPRYVRRQLAAIFEECPRVQLDEQSKTWKVEWGMKQPRKAKAIATAPKVAFLLQRLNTFKPGQSADFKE